MRHCLCPACHGDQVKAHRQAGVRGDRAPRLRRMPPGIRGAVRSCHGHQNKRKALCRTDGRKNRSALFSRKTATPATCAAAPTATGERDTAVAKATDQSCLVCHKGYFVGTDYYGMAPREDSLRYQRGKTAYGETYLKMAPDVHAEAGLTCGACHSMKSLTAGRSRQKHAPIVTR